MIETTPDVHNYCSDFFTCPILNTSHLVAVELALKAFPYGVCVRARVCLCVLCVCVCVCVCGGGGGGGLAHTWKWFMNMYIQVVVKDHQKCNG